MAELGIAAAIAGIVGLGMQVSQGLNLYIDSASDAKPRMQAIAIDIDLALEVVYELKSTIEDPIRKALISDKAERIATETISQFRRVFEQIVQKLPQSGQSDITLSQRLKWPFKESKVKLLRAELGSARATLQLLMEVIMFAFMKKWYDDHCIAWYILLSC